ncbi:hypothetical protein KY317_03995 [Candidatus Woesearchaeota archaeon]|nr:hypothetical protein [Candidatus Woesearchaeota archaeon]
MAGEEPLFRGAIVFLEKIGVFTVVLPFLLIFTIVFAILEKTKVLGTEDIEGSKYTKKNLNAIVAFVVAFLVVASTRLVAVINTALANIVLLLLLSVFFLVLVGSFFKEEGGVFLEKGGWRTLFMVIMFIGIVVIFLDALDWLSPLWDYLSSHIGTQWIGSLILLILVVLFIMYITKERKPVKPAGGESS